MDICHSDWCEWMPKAEALFEKAHLSLNPHEISDLYWKTRTMFAAYLDENPRIDYDAPFRAWGVVRTIFKAMTSAEQRIGALAYIESLKSSDNSDTRNMGKIIEEELLKIFMTGVLPPTPEEFYKDRVKKE